MNSQIIAALIGATATVAASVLAFVLRSNPVIDRLVHLGKYPDWRGRWESNWKYLDDDIEEISVIEIKKQRGGRMYGEFHTKNVPAQVFLFDATYNGRFITSTWRPKDTHIVDYGASFLEIQGDGSFQGYFAEFDWSSNKVRPGRLLVRRLATT
ncbi:MAG: hypothetical protein HW384_254 [Dehalococcoidia bacterium]|nr:hypothetical protein [Dehalococcoidia bacterium]